MAAIPDGTTFETTFGSSSLGYPIDVGFDRGTTFIQLGLDDAPTASGVGRLSVFVNDGRTARTVGSATLDTTPFRAYLR